MLKPGKYEVLTFETSTGEIPYLEWLKQMDWKTEDRILTRVARMQNGQFGDYKTIDRGLYELRFFFGAGYRVYFGEHQGKTILLFERRRQILSKTGHQQGKGILENLLGE